MMTRTTRMLYLEEVSDTDKSEIIDDSVPVGNGRQKGGKTTQKGAKPTTPTADAAVNTEILPQIDVTLSLSPVSTSRPNKANKIFPMNDAQDETPKQIEKDSQVFVVTNPIDHGFKSNDNPNFIPKPCKTFQDHDEMKTVQDTLLYNILKELFFCMKTSGIFFIRRKSNRGGCRGFWTNCSNLQVYCAAMCLLLLGNFIRSLAAFSDNNGFGPKLFFKFMASLFFYESVSRAMLAFWSCWRKKHGVQELFLSLERICYPDKIIPYETSLRRTMHAFLVLTFVLSFANAGMTAYGMFGPPDVRELFNLYLVPVPPESSGVLIFKVFLLLLTFVNGTVAILSLTFYTIVCYILYKEFEYFCRMFAMKIRPDGFFVEDLEKFRLRHQKRCELVDNSDQFLKYYIANTYLTNIPLLCLLLYSIVYSDDGQGIAYRLISTFRLIYVLIQMMVLSVAATIINAQAHAPLADIYNIRTHSATCERQLEVGMFLNKLTGTSIGLTAWDMFVINKPTVLAVIGMILTYFFLLVQFKNPMDPDAHCFCNFTTFELNCSSAYGV